MRPISQQLIHTALHAINLFLWHFAVRLIDF